LPQVRTILAESPFRVNSEVSAPMFLSSSKSLSSRATNQSVDASSLWNDIAAINSINQTYEIADNFEIWNYRSHLLLSELKDQITRFSCSGGIWTQTTDVEGEVNGLLTYDRRLSRVDEKLWKDDIQALYDAAKART
jgi:hypothetical protein